MITLIRTKRRDEGCNRREILTYRYIRSDIYRKELQTKLQIESLPIILCQPFPYVQILYMEYGGRLKLESHRKLPKARSKNSFCTVP